MTSTAFSAHRRVLFAALVGATAVQPLHAGTQTVLRVDLIGGAGVETDPLLTGGADRASGFVDGEVRPVLTVSDDRGGATLEGYYRRKEYLRSYPATDGFGFITRSVYRPSEQIRVNSSVVFDDAILDAQSLFGSDPTSTGTTGTTGTDVNLPTPPTASTGVQAGDVGLVGLRQRRSQLLADLALSIKAGQRDDWTLGISGVRARYPGTIVASNYTSYGISGTYTRLLNERNTVGITVSEQNTQLEGVAGSARVISPQIVYKLRLPHNWSVNLSGGASFVSGNAVQSVGQSTSLAFQAEVCSGGERIRACISAARTVSPSGTSGVGPVTVGRLSYDYRFNRVSDLSIEANFSAVDRGTSVALTESERFYTASANYSRNVTDRLQFVVGARYERREGGTSPGLSAGSLRIGLTYSLGRRG